MTAGGDCRIARPDPSHLTTLLLTPIALATTPLPRVDWSPSFVLLLLYLGIPGTAVAYWAVAMASRHLPAVTTSLGLLATRW